MTIRYATIWNEHRRESSPFQGGGRDGDAAIPMENTPAKAKPVKKSSGRKVCSGEQLAALLDTHRWTQRKPKK
jgi:hypothetical protein